MRYLLAAALALSLLSLGPSLRAETFSRGGIVVENPWVRATIGTLPNTAGYLSVTNETGQTQRLIAVTIEGAEKVELHETRDGAMRAIESVEIAPGETVTFQPNGWHLMVGPLRLALEEGSTILGSATFEPGGTLPLEFRVEAANAMKSGSAHH